MHCHSAHQFVLALPANPASHSGLPGANDVYIPRYDQLSITGQSPEAANITANFLSISEPTICTLTYAVARHWTIADTTSPVAEISDCQVITTHISVDEGPLIHVATSANDTNLAAFELECPIQPPSPDCNTSEPVKDRNDLFSELRLDNALAPKLFTFPARTYKMPRFIVSRPNLIHCALCDHLHRST